MTCHRVSPARIPGKGSWVGQQRPQQAIPHPEQLVLKGRCEAIEEKIEHHAGNAHSIVVLPTATQMRLVRRARQQEQCAAPCDNHGNPGVPPTAAPQEHWQHLATLCHLHGHCLVSPTIQTDTPATLNVDGLGTYRLDREGDVLEGLILGGGGNGVANGN
eukprot:scaffold1650_cov351-Prasinococcus_capsulatus_cf.AAC.9